MDLFKSLIKFFNLKSNNKGTFDTNKYTLMQKGQYYNGTSNHQEHNNNSDYWDILLSDLKDKKKWKGKNALDFASGKGRNVTNMLDLCEWNRVDGIDLSIKNIEFCKKKLY